MLNGDPFARRPGLGDRRAQHRVQDRWRQQDGGGKTAVGTVTFTNFKEPQTVTLDLVNTDAGWRIADIRSRSGSLRALYKLK